MKITITYCSQWNYLPQASRLEAELKKQFSAEIELIPGSGGIYEIMANGRPIFSKQTVGRFAEPEEIISIIRNYGQPGPK